MHDLHPTIRPAVSWILLATMWLPLSPARAAESVVMRLPLAFSNTAAKLPEAPPQPGTLASDEDSSTLHLAILSGDGAVNILKKKITVAPVVQVLDAANHPIRGAVVTLAAPASGASVEFAHGTRTAMLVTDSDGKVRPADLMAVNTGRFVYHVRALYQEREATGTIAQTNVANAPADGAPSGQAAVSGQKGGMPHWAYAALIGGAAAAIGIGVSLGMHQSGKTSSTPTTGTIGSPGSVSVGTGH